jgi:hypothetical protein
VDLVLPPPLSEFGEFRAASPENGGCGSEAPCVEVADGPGGWRAVRDSKLGDNSPVLTFTAAEWAVFTSGVRNGEFN